MTIKFKRFETNIWHKEYNQGLSELQTMINLWIEVSKCKVINVCFDTGSQRDLQSSWIDAILVYEYTD